ERVAADAHFQEFLLVAEAQFGRVVGEVERVERSGRAGRRGVGEGKRCRPRRMRGRRYTRRYRMRSREPAEASRELPEQFRTHAQFGRPVRHIVEGAAFDEGFDFVALDGDAGQEILEGAERAALVAFAEEGGDG